MSENSHIKSDTTEVSLSNASASLIQAIYHAATGKTENLSKRYTRNVIVRKGDLDQLKYKLKQQLDLHELVVEPTISIKAIFNNEEQQQYSSWERFSALETSRTEITSEIIVRYEFLIKLPNSTEKPQRYIVTVDIDSHLPLVADKPTHIEIPWFVIRKFPTITISIDFIDYLLAKNLQHVIEGWHHALEEVKSPNWVEWCCAKQLNWRFLLSRIGYLGSAGFIGMYLWQRGGVINSVGELGYLIAVLICFSVFTNIATTYIGIWFSETIHRSLVPSTILLTVGDERAFSKVTKEQSKSFTHMFSAVGGTLLAIIVNVAASFLYSWMTK